MKRRWATIDDVAEAAGVSVATVSRALRDLPHVAPATRQRIQLAAEELNYRPNRSASALAAGRTRAVSMAVPMLDSWYFSQVMAGAESLLSRAGYDLLLISVDSNERRKRLLGGPFVNRIDGLIVVDLRIPEEERAGLLAGPAAVVTIGIELPGVSSVRVDDHGIGFEAVNHLIELGHRRIALIAGTTDDPLRFAVPNHRRAGYAAALAKAGLTPRADYEVDGHFTLDGGRQAMVQLLDMAEPPTAVFAMSDEMAFGAIDALRGRGLDTPADISIIGVDDHEFAPVVGLTTIGQSVADHGAVAAQLLLDQMGSPASEPSVHTPPTELIERRTTARI